MSLKLTDDQKTVFDRVKYFLFDDENPVIVIKGSAGTGKTTLTKYIADYISDGGKLSMVAIAPTHKARRVMNNALNGDRFMTIPSMTVASILGKMREHSYIGSHKYTNGSKQKMDRYDCFILDEVSMVSDKDLEEIIDYVCEYDKKLILIGDDCQIPSPSQQLKREGNICYKPDSSAFEIENMCHLTEIVRQAKNSKIIVIASYLRDHLYEENTIQDILTGSNVDASSICIDLGSLYTSFGKDFKEGLDTRIVAYTNAAVRAHNTHIRTLLNYQEYLVVGELLTGYVNVGYPVPVIENGTDYKVTKIQTVTNWSIAGFTGLTGFLVDLEDLCDSTHISTNLFFIFVKHSSNKLFMKELVKRAEKVNRVRSTKNDYRLYCQLKNRAVFLEDVYMYANTVMTETNIRQLHPLLFTRVSEVINVANKGKIDSELTEKITEQYGELIEDRLSDNKTFADTEMLADRYMVVEKDIYYGYAITAHKSQGSTYDSVYVDENDFNKISNKWNYRMRVLENRYKERNQLRYVAYTRASKSLSIVVDRD